MLCKEFSVRFFLILLSLGLAVSCPAAVRVELLAGNQFRVLWQEREVVLPSRPELRNVGGGKRQVYDPTARVFREVDIPASQGVLFTALNKQGDPILLGEGTLAVTKAGAGCVYRQTFANAGAFWQVTLQPVDENGLDTVIEAEVAPEFWLIGVEMKLLDLSLDKATADYGGLGQWRRNLPTSKGLLVGPVPGDIRINYPSNNLFVPAAVLQDTKTAVGVCRLGVHDVWRAQFGELSLSPKSGKYEVRVATGWAEAISTACLYQNRFEQHYRLRFAEPRPAGPAGYLQLVDAKDLWADYMKEMELHVPIQPNPPYSREKNNILIMNFFMAENHYSTERNPQGWVMNHPEWKSNPWEFPAEAATKSGEELKKLTGFTDENFGKPVKWIKAFAEKSVREMQETKALANVAWRSATARGAHNLSLDYLPDTHYFHPELEERTAVDGPVRDWDWAVADIELLAPDGKVLVRKKGVELHAVDWSKLRKLSRYEDYRQRLAFKAEDIQADAAEYVKAAGGYGAEERYRDFTRLYIKVVEPQARLVGAKVGDLVELAAVPVVGDPALAAKNLALKARITGVTRAAIDVWAKTMTDADCEIGFLIREDFLMGPPWQMTFMRLDWTAEWQYTLLRQRVEWHQARFGKKCRWYYLDVFANETPDFILQRLRRDFPDCFFFVEHPNGVVLRTMQSWNWFGTFTALELYLNPDALAIVLPERVFTKDKAANLEWIKNTWKNPHYIYATHRGARGLVTMAAEAGVGRDTEHPTSSPL
jgi:hypothetical protein